MANARQQTVCFLVCRGDVGQVGRALLLKHWQRALRHEAGARTGADIEDVHRMRVATRRLRSAFRFFGAYMALPRIKTRSSPGCETWRGGWARCGTSTY